MTHQTNTNSQGFTLIELLVVISIIGLLSSVVVGSLSSAKKKAEGAKIVQNMNQLKIALELYKNDHGEYPSEGEPMSTTVGIDYLRSVLVPGKYIPSISNPAMVPPFWDYAPVLYATAGAMYDESMDFYATCGGKKLKSYILEFYNDQDLNFSREGYNTGGIYYDDVESFFTMGDNSHWYCIGE